MPRDLPLNPYAAIPLAEWEARLFSPAPLEERYRAWLAVTRLATLATVSQHALRLLDDPEAEFRAAACRWLAQAVRQGQLAEQQAALRAAWTRCLHDADLDVQLEAARGLVHLDPPPVELADVVLRLLAHAEGQTTTLAVLVELSGACPHLAASLLPRLRGWLSSATEVELREAAAATLARWGACSAPAEAELAAALDDESPLVREHAAIALRQLPQITEATLAALQAAREDEDAGVRGAVDAALQQHAPAG